MIALTINGKIVRTKGAPDTPLLWILRDELKLTGTRFGCGEGLCGACTVHLDGVPTRACLTPLSAVGKRRLTTIEGLATQTGVRGPALQAAWEAINVAQCGYCQSGQLMSACALLVRKAAPTDADIDEAMSGNICRCGSYPRIRAAIHSAAASVQAAQPASGKEKT
jgi:isoquinoline 1-oxidoreductase alpha subunit